MNDNTYHHEVESLFAPFDKNLKMDLDGQRQRDTLPYMELFKFKWREQKFKPYGDNRYLILRRAHTERQRQHQSEHLIDLIEVHLDAWEWIWDWFSSITMATATRWVHKTCCPACSFLRPFDYKSNFRNFRQFI